MLRRSFKNFKQIYAIRSFRTSTCSRNKDGSDKDDKEISASVATRFQVFKDESVGVIFDIEEERAKRRLEDEMGVTDDADEQSYQYTPSMYEGLNLERGKTGVYDIEDLVEVLKRENAIDLIVIKIPKELAYVDYMCVITGSSYRHMLGIATFVRKVYKLKRGKKDEIPRIEGKGCKNWMCLDLGNIALHIFSKEARDNYSLETLWTMGEEYEKRTNKIDKVEEMYDEFIIKAAETNQSSQ